MFDSTEMARLFCMSACNLIQQHLHDSAWFCCVVIKLVVDSSVILGFSSNFFFVIFICNLIPSSSAVYNYQQKLTFSISLDTGPWHLSSGSALCLQEPWTTLQHDGTEYAPKRYNQETRPWSSQPRKGIYPSVYVNQIKSHCLIQYIFLLISQQYMLC